MNDATTRDVVIAGRRTSVRMEQPFWMALDAITDREDVPLNVLLTRIERSLPVDGNMSSAVRVFALSYFFALAQHEIPPRLPAVGTGMTKPWPRG
ncbi:ribbon-helix-helix domain-containing protein [Mycobacterium sp. KBS0706]|uniref:ribbon-helix-helix domain-containing protein n=1 Tax=Mycobacterium sp. KBS0706 TaxID=2578109 RepID=UPI00110F703A|nr:ribbon-helix-helix domain-containing protein [Mycobacterium sp. KBS0706]TSD87170.1 ribbon-helix-helix domain-containing protein [Mycobacterium sp. KBS0706]